ncbi:MAG: DUF1598 domain-containing protein [Phycisphaeraceae bacterium]
MPTPPRLRAVSFALFFALAAAPAALAQNTFGFDPTGVYLDPSGVLRARKIDDGGKFIALLNRAAAKDEDKQLRYISLPKLFAEVRKHIDAGTPIPDDLKYLGGMTKLKYLFVRPDEKDLILAGLAEPYDTKSADRPLGLHTGRPVLQLDDLVLALRTTGPGRAGQAFGCKIDMPKENMQKMMQKLAGMTGVVKQFPDQDGQVAKAMAQAAGEQQIDFLNLKADSRLAYVAVEADYLLKRMVIGLDKPPIKGVVTYLSTQTTPDPVSNRFWFEVSYEPLIASADGNAFEIRGQSLKINTRQHFTYAPGEDKEATPSAKQYAAHVTKHFERLSQAIPAFADLANLSDLSLAAALIGSDKLHDKAQWDMTWVLDEKGYEVAKVKVPTTAETLVNSKRTTRMVIFVGGGVLLSYGEVTGKREKDEGKLAASNKGTGGEVSVLVKP